MLVLLGIGEVGHQAVLMRLCSQLSVAKLEVSDL